MIKINRTAVEDEESEAKEDCNDFRIASDRSGSQAEAETGLQCKLFSWIWKDDERKKM
jgi:hypothetical protein